MAERGPVSPVLSDLTSTSAFSELVPLLLRGLDTDSDTDRDSDHDIGGPSSHGTFPRKHPLTPTKMEKNLARHVTAGTDDGGGGGAANKPGGLTLDPNLDEAIQFEHSLTFLEACKLYPAAIGWSAFVSLGVIMLAFDPQLLGNLYAMPRFKLDFGYLYEGEVS